MSDEAKLIPYLPAVEKWPTRKTPQARFDTTVQAAMNQMSGMVKSLNDDFIPTVNDLIDEMNIVVQEQEHIRAVGENIDKIIDVEHALPMLGVVQDNLPVLYEVRDALPHIKAAPGHADRAENAADHSQASAGSAREYLEQVSAIASPGILASAAFNIRKPFIVHESLSAGSVLTLPAHYFPLRDTLFLGFDGTLCTPRKAGVEPFGEYQYTEIGSDPSILSNQIVIHFDAPAGSVFDVWVVASNIERNTAEAAAFAEQAREYAQSAAESSVEATVQADRATAAANRADGIVGTGPHPRVHTMMQDEDAAEGESLTTPPYYPFVSGIRVFYDGLLLSSGIHYTETPAAQNGGQSTTINILFETEAGAIWEFHTWDSSAGDTPAQQAISLTQVGVNETEADDITMTFTPFSSGPKLEEIDVTFYPETL